MKKWTVVFLLLLVAVFFAACDDNEEDNKEDIKDQLSGQITGEWYSGESDGLFFDTENKMFYYGYDDDANGIIDWQTETTTSGEIADHSDYDETDGYIVIKVVVDTWESYGADTFTVVRWKDCDGITLAESIATKLTEDYQPDGPQSYESVDAALENLTAENGYFEYYGTYTKK